LDKRLAKELTWPLPDDHQARLKLDWHREKIANFYSFHIPVGLELERHRIRFPTVAERPEIGSRKASDCFGLGTLGFIKTICPSKNMT